MAKKLSESSEHFTFKASAHRLEVDGSIVIEQVTPLGLYPEWRGLKLDLPQ